VPLITAIMRSLREHKLEARRLSQAAGELASRPGRPDRSQLIAHEELVRAARDADGRYEEALDELHSLDVYCADPIQGIALFPFVHDDRRAWFIYDHFDNEPVRFWRYQNDPPETRRPVPARLQKAARTP
jgi:hypothetical protein